MKRILLISILLLSVVAYSQGWLSKNAVRVEDKTASLKITFTDSSFVDLQKSRITYINDTKGSKYVTIGFGYAGATTSVFTIPYDGITQPITASAKELSQTLNTMLQ